MAKAHRRGADTGSATPATVQLDAAGVAYRTREYEHADDVHDFGDEAAALLDVAAERIFKTLMVELEPAPSRGPALSIGIVPVTGRLDLKALAQAAGAKRARMADPATAERKSGYVVGGISPFGQKTPLPTYLDSSAEQAETILVSGGRRGFDIELAPNDLISVLQAHYADIARG